MFLGLGFRLGPPSWPRSEKVGTVAFFQFCRNFSRGTLPTKKGERRKGTTGGPSRGNQREATREDTFGSVGQK